MKLVKKIKLKTNKFERELFDFWLRRCRILYNVAIDERKYYYQATGKYLSLYEQKKELVDIKNYDCTWKDIPNKALQEIIFRVDKSFKSFFKGNGFPKYHNKDSFNSIEFVEKDVRIKNNLVFLPKMKYGIKGFESFPINYSGVKLIKENNEYYLGFIVEYNVDNKICNDESVGCDLGLKTLLTDSNGYEIKRFSVKLIKRYENRIKKLNKSLSAKKKRSKSHEKVKKQLNKTYIRLKNSRNDYLHKVSSTYVKQLKEDKIYVGDLTVKELMKNDKSRKEKNFNRTYGTSSIGIFVNYLKYKSVKYNKILNIVGEEYTSKTCSCCGTVKYDLKVSDRTYNCINCGLEIKRDVNGALNILKVGLKTFNPIGINLDEIKSKHSLRKNCSVRATT